MTSKNDDCETPHRSRDPQGRFAENSFAAIYDALDREVRRIDQALLHEISRVDGLREADQEAIKAALISAEKAVATALAAAKEATTKAEASQLRTNDSQNEFRAQLKDQAATFLTRNEYDLAHKALENKIDTATDTNSQEIGNLRSRLDIGPPSLPVLQARSDEAAGRSKAGTDSRALTFSLIAVGFGFLGFLIGLAGVIINLTR